LWKNCKKGPSIRTLVVVIYNEQERTLLLRYDTGGSSFEDAEVCPDLTKKQQQEESDLKDKAVKRTYTYAKRKRGQAKKTWSGLW
jgi:hypothetical protein